MLDLVGICLQSFEFIEKVRRYRYFVFMILTFFVFVVCLSSSSSLFLTACIPRGLAFRFFEPYLPDFVIYGLGIFTS